jgi:hypothetical protein
MDVNHCPHVRTKSHSKFPMYAQNSKFSQPVTFPTQARQGDPKDPPPTHTPPPTAQHLHRQILRREGGSGGPYRGIGSEVGIEQFRKNFIGM